MEVRKSIKPHPRMTMDDTAHCRACGSESLVRVAGTTRCNQCGKQFGTIPDLNFGVTRKQALAGVNKPTMSELVEKLRK